MLNMTFPIGVCNDYCCFCKLNLLSRSLENLEDKHIFNFGTNINGLYNMKNRQCHEWCFASNVGKELYVDNLYKDKWHLQCYYCTLKDTITYTKDSVHISKCIIKSRELYHLEILGYLSFCLPCFETMASKSFLNYKPL